MPFDGIPGITQGRGDARPQVIYKCIQKLFEKHNNLQTVLSLLTELHHHRRFFSTRLSCNDSSKSAGKQRHLQMGTKIVPHGPHLAAPVSPASKAICRPAFARICTCVMSVAAQTKTPLHMMRHVTVFTAIKKQRQRPQHARLVHLSFT
jgi:hypothetical protein